MTRYERANEDFVGQQRMQQQDMVREQDQHLEALDTSLSRIGEMARTINVELEEQDR